MEKRKVTVLMMISVVLSWILTMTALAEDVSRITKEQLKGMLGDPNTAIIDVRANVDWVGSNLKIKGAIREDPRRVNSWMEKYPKEKTLVFYCS
jgi:rhodanese-related sulfurtransferase